MARRGLSDLLRKQTPSGSGFRPNMPMVPPSRGGFRPNMPMVPPGMSRATQMPPGMSRAMGARQVTPDMIRQMRQSQPPTPPRLQGQLAQQMPPGQQMPPELLRMQKQFAQSRLPGQMMNPGMGRPPPGQMMNPGMGRPPPGQMMNPGMGRPPPGQMPGGLGAANMGSPGFAGAMKKGGSVKTKKSSVSKAKSKTKFKGDGCATKGKTKGRMC